MRTSPQILAALAALFTSGLGAQPSRGAEPVSLEDRGWHEAWEAPQGYRGPLVYVHFRSVVPEATSTGRISSLESGESEAAPGDHPISAR